MLKIIESRPWAIRCLQLLLLVVLLGAWELRAANNNIFQFFFSRPSRILIRVWEWLSGAAIYKHATQTLAETAMGFAIGVGTGLTLALICYYAPLLHRLVKPFIEIANAMPRVVFGPLFILWFGLGLTSKAMLAASLVVFIVFFGTLMGLQEVDRNIVHKVELFGATRVDLLLHVLLPSALSWVFTSLRTGVGFALAGAVVGEYVGSSRGIGYQIALAEGNLDATGIFAGLVVLSGLVIVLNAVLARVERLLSPWKVA